MPRKQKPKKATHEFEVRKATAVRAMVAHVHGMLPYIRITLETQHNEEVIIEMPFEVASEFLNQAIAAHSTIAPPLKVPRMHF